MKTKTVWFPNAEEGVKALAENLISQGERIEELEKAFAEFVQSNTKVVKMVTVLLGSAARLIEKQQAEIDELKKE